MLTLVEAADGPGAAFALASRPSSKGISPLGAACAYGGAPELAAATVRMPRCCASLFSFVCASV